MAQPFPFPHHPPGRRGWVPAAIVAAGIIIAAAVIAGAVTANGHRSDTAIGANPATAESTCAAWRATASALKDIPELPAGWTWQTPNIDMLIANHSALVSQTLDTFEPRIGDTPPDLAAAARTFVSARRHEILLLANRTYTRTDGAQGDAAFEQLNQFCIATAPA